MINKMMGLLFALAAMVAVPVGAQAAACTAPAWDPEFQYEGWELVTYDSAHFMAKWWVKGTPPDRTDEWGPWDFIEDCDSGVAPDPVPVVSPLSRSFSSGGGSDVVFTLNTDGDVLVSVDNSSLGVPLDTGDYSLNSFDLTFSATYLSSLTVGNYSFQLNFASAAPLTVDINVVDVSSPPQTQTLTPQDAVLSYDAVLTNGQVELKHGEAQWLYTAPVSGEYVVEFDYESPYGEKTNTFYVGGNTQQVVTPITNGTTEVYSITANLSAGDQVIGVDGSNSNWGYIFLGDVRVSPSVAVPQDPTLSPASKSVVLGSGTSVSYSLNAGSYSFSGLSNGGVALQQGVDYSLSASSLTLEAGYISTLAAGTYTLTATFDGADLGSKSVSVELQVDTAPVVMPSVSPSSISVQAGSSTSVSYSLDTGSYSFSSLSNGGTELQQGVDYTASGTSLTLEGGYISTLAVGTYTLTSTFYDADLGSQTVSVDLQVDSVPVVMPSVSPASITVQAGSGASVSYSLDSGSYSFSGLSNGGTVLQQGVDYTLSATSLTLESGYISTLAVGTYTLTSTFDDADLGSQTVSVELRVESAPVVMPSVSPSSKSVEAGSGISVSYSVDAGSYSFSSLSNGGTVLQSGTDYTVSGGSLSLSGGYINSLAVGTYTLTATFDDADLGSQSVAVELRVDSAPVVMPTISPASQTVNVGAPTALAFSLNTGTFTFSGVDADGVALPATDYSYSGGVLTLNESYIATLTAGQTVSYSAQFTSTYNGSATADFMVTATQALTGDCFDLNTVTLEGGAYVQDGRAKVTGTNGSAAYWTASVAKAGQYQVLLTYNTEGGDKIVSFMLDDGGRSNMTWPDTPATAPQDMEFVQNLTAGIHRIGMINRDGDWGWASVQKLCVNFLGSLAVNSPQAFDNLISGADIVVDFTKEGTGDLTYAVNGGTTQVYSGATPLVIPTSGDGLYDLEIGVAGTNLKKVLRVQVGNAPGPFYVDTLGSQFVLGNRPFYFNGSNQYYLMYKPEPMAEDFFKRAKYLGMTAVRTWMFCNDTKTHDGVCINMKSGEDFLLTKANRTAEEQAIVDRSFELFDNYVALAHQYDVKLVLSLADYWNYFGNLDSYGAPHYSTPSSVTKFKDFITALLQHHNPLTGYTYAEDPAIMMWELANEPRCSSGCDAQIFKAWASDISSLIKSLAPNQLVSIGAESSFAHNGSGDDFNFIKTVNDLPTIDAISAHLYPTWWSMSDAETLSNIDQLAEVGRELSKPTYIGEFSWPVASEASVTQDLQTRYQKFVDWYARAEQNKDAIGGMLAWQLSGLEWGNGETPLDGCQWCAGPYGEPTGGWTANNDGFQMYCAITAEEATLTETGAPGDNKEGNIIHIDLHKPVCDLLTDRSAYYESLNQ
ncbi:X2-like carbohydrate binding domain-containing protein [Microbulbifer sp. SAOS-129_SWC]|uniref:X2-like carbohydrate binding domain-containing protein n=1 Tax=Microbulbifer sp. SAOS-129_SWC TaxID=3145235 RepID=UPI0032178CB4